MKKIQFALDEEKYEKVKDKLHEHKLTWQKVCEQMSDYIIFSDSIDEAGLPLYEMSPSIRKMALSEIEGHIETAAWKYVQLHLDPGGDNTNHWTKALQAALKEIVKSNLCKPFKRGFMFDKEELDEILDEMWPHGVKLAAGHLGIDQKKVKVKQPSIDELFKFAGVDLTFGKVK